MKLTKISLIETFLEFGESPSDAHKLADHVFEGINRQGGVIVELGWKAKAGIAAAKGLPHGIGGVAKNIGKSVAGSVGDNIKDRIGKAFGKKQNKGMASKLRNSKIAKLWKNKNKR